MDKIKIVQSRWGPHALTLLLLFFTTGVLANHVVQSPLPDHPSAFWSQSLQAGKNLVSMSEGLQNMPDVTVAASALSDFHLSLEKSIDNLQQAKAAEGHADRQKYLLTLTYTQLQTAKSAFTRAKLQLLPVGSLSETTQSLIKEIDQKLAGQILLLSQELSP